MPKLAAAFAFFTLIASFGAGNMVQANATAGVFLQVFNIPIEVLGYSLRV